MRIIDKEFEVLLTKEQIDSIVTEFAQKINEAYKGKELVIVGILNGSFLFIADLIRKLSVDTEIIFLKYKSYEGMVPGEMKVQLGLEEDIENKHVLILEDIVDTGKTIVRIAQDLGEHEPASLKYGSLFVKPDTYQGKVEISFVGQKLSRDFVVGYGMDYRGKGRNLSDLYKARES